MAEIIDLYKDWTPEMVEAVKVHRNRGGCRSEEHARSISKSLKRFYARLTLEEVEVRTSRSFLGEASKKKSLETRCSLPEEASLFENHEGGKVRERD